MTFPHFPNWRTNLAGAGALVYAVADLIVMFHNKEWDSNRLGMSVMAILTGLGFIAARDATASVQAHQEQQRAINMNAVGLAQVKQEAVAAKVEACLAKEEVAAVREIAESK